MESLPLGKSLLYIIILLLGILLSACSPNLETGGGTLPEESTPEAKSTGTRTTEATVPPASAPESSSVAQPSGEQGSQSGGTESMSGKPRYSGPLVRVSIRLSYPSVLDAGYSLGAITTDQAAQAYRDELEEKQRALVKQIEEYCGEAVPLHWQMTLTSDVISVEVREAALEWIRSLPEVLAAEKENQNETNH